jgi:hypothetical protein
MPDRADPGTADHVPHLVFKSRIVGYLELLHAVKLNARGWSGFQGGIENLLLHFRGERPGRPFAPLSLANGLDTTVGESGPHQNSRPGKACLLSDRSRIRDVVNI